MLWTRHLPVHCEGCHRPVCFDDALERERPVLGQVRGPPGEEIVSRRCTEKVRNVPGEQAVPEVSHHRVGRLTTQELDPNVPCVIAATPGRAEPVAVEHEPPRLIGNQQRKASVGKVIAGGLHPIPGSGGRHKGHVYGADTVGDQRGCLAFIDYLLRVLHAVNGVSHKRPSSRSKVRQ